MEYYYIILIVVAVIACCCCCYYCFKWLCEDEKRSSKLKQRSRDLEGGLHHTSWNTHDSLELVPLHSASDTDNEIYSIQEAAEIADREHGTVLRTNNGDVYINTPGGTHAEILFIEGDTSARTVTEIWLTNSPCAACSKRLLEFYKGSNKKRTVYIGRIYHLHDETDEEGLLTLLHNGFEIQIWEELDEIFSKDKAQGHRYRHFERTHDYIKNLYNEANLPPPF